MATIDVHKAKDGSITYRVRVRRKGERIQTASFPTLKGAKRWATMVEGQMIEGRHFPINKPTCTLTELLERYTAEILPRKSLGAQREEGYLIRYWKKHLGYKLVSEITPADIIRHRDTIARKNKPATVLKYLGILSHVFTIAIREYQILEVNPVSKVSKPPQPRGRVRFLTDEERARLLDACRKNQNHYLYPLVIIALYTGLRRGSLLSLTRDMVDCETGIIHLEKMKNGTRHALPLVGEALVLVKERCEQLTGQPKGHLFPHNPHIPWNSYRKSWERAVKNAELHDFTFHSIRHTVASYLVQSGIPLYTVGVILNHVNPALMTYRYAHLQTEHLRDALETLSQRLSS